MATTPPSPTAGEMSIRTLDKGLAVLEAVAATGRRGAAIGELVAGLGVNRSTLYRFLSALTRRGYLEAIEGSDRYRLGYACLTLASATVAGLALREVGAPILEDLNRRTHETVHIVVLDHGEVVTIDRLEADYPITLRTQIGARRPAHATATGKAMLAFLADDHVDDILAQGMAPLTDRTITDPRRFKRQLHEVRLCGYALDDEELAVGIRCVAAPVFDFNGRVVGAVSLCAPAQRVSPERLAELGTPVMDAARRLSRQLGYRTRDDHHRPPAS